MRSIDESTETIVSRLVALFAKKKAKQRPKEQKVDEIGTLALSLFPTSTDAMMLLVYLHGVMTVGVFQKCPQFF